MSDIFEKPKLSRVHLLKSWPESFDAIVAGEKPFDVRLNDREYRVGDWCKLHWYDPTLETYNGDACYRRIGWMSTSAVYEGAGITHGYVVIGYVAGHPEGDYEIIEPKA